MIERWLGIVVSGEKLIIVDAEVPKSGPITIIADQTIDLPKGDRAQAYGTIHRRMFDYVCEKKIQRVIIKESAISLSGMKKSHLLSAELRGVVMCACAMACPTRAVSKANVSRTFGERNSDEYINDGSFWATEINGRPLRTGSREAVFYMIAMRDK